MAGTLAALACASEYLRRWNDREPIATGAMSLFEFVSVIIAVILALSLGQLLLGVSALVKARRQVQGFLPHTLWLGAVFLGILAHW